MRLEQSPQEGAACFWSGSSALELVRDHFLIKDPSPSAHHKTVICCYAFEIVYIGGVWQAFSAAAAAASGATTTAAAAEPPRRAGVAAKGGHADSHPQGATLCPQHGAQVPALLLDVATIIRAPSLIVVSEGLTLPLMLPALLLGRRQVGRRSARRCHRSTCGASLGVPLSATRSAARSGPRPST